MKRQTLTQFLILFILLLGACGVGLPQSQTTQEQIGPRTVTDICKEPERYAGQIITLDGVFQGWRADECRFPTSANPAITRSDWLIRTGTDCLYVTGGILAGFDSMNPDDVGRRMELKAIVMLSKNGKVYLKYLDGQPLGP